MKKILGMGMMVCALSLCFVGCRQEENRTVEVAYTVHGDTVEVLQSHWSSMLKVDRVQMLPYRKQIVTAGIIRPIPTQYAPVASPFAGRIVQSYVTMGQQVKQGTRLFDIVCPDFTDAQKEYFQALSTCELARCDWQRKLDLSHNGVSSQKELEEAQTALLIAEKDLENAEMALNVYRVNDLSSMRLGQPLAVCAPIDGILIENNIVNGQYLRDDAEPVAVVADLSKVWVSAQVKEKDIRYITEGDALGIEVAAYPGVHLDGQVFHVEESVDEDTRSIQVLSVCNNADELLKLGMYVNVCFRSEAVDMPVIAETALLQGVDDNYVLVEAAPNVYVRRAVQVEATTDHGVVISGGLDSTDKVVTEGGYCLKI